MRYCPKCNEFIEEHNFYNSSRYYCKSCCDKMQKNWREKNYVYKGRRKKYSIKYIKRGVVHVKEWGYTVKVFSKRADARKWVETQQLKNVRIKKPIEKVEVKKSKIVQIITGEQEVCTKKQLPFTKLLE